MPLRTGGRNRTNGIYLLTNYVLTDKFCMELMLIRPGHRIFNVPGNANYALSRVALMENHPYAVFVPSVLNSCSGVVAL